MDQEKLQATLNAHFSTVLGREAGVAIQDTQPLSGIAAGYPRWQSLISYVDEQGQLVERGVRFIMDKENPIVQEVLEACVAPKKWLHIRMPDRSVWEVPLTPLMRLAMERQFGKEGEASVQEQLAFRLDATTGTELIDDLYEYIKWEDIAPLATQIKPPDAPYEKWWPTQIDHWTDLGIVSKEG